MSKFVDFDWKEKCGLIELRLFVGFLKIVNYAGKVIGIIKIPHNNVKRVNN